MRPSSLACMRCSCLSWKLLVGGGVRGTPKYEGRFSINLVTFPRSGACCSLCANCSPSPSARLWSGSNSSHWSGSSGPDIAACAAISSSNDGGWLCPAPYCDKTAAIVLAWFWPNSCTSAASTLFCISLRCRQIDVEVFVSFQLAKPIGSHDPLGHQLQWLISSELP